MQTRRIAAVVAVLSMVAAWAWAQTSGTNTQERNGYYFNATTGQRTTADGKVLVDDPLRVEDFGVVNLVASVAIDTGGVGGANFRYSAPIYVGDYTTGRIVLHVTAASAGDTSGTYNYGVTVFPLTVANGDDWTTVGNPLPTQTSPGATDTLGVRYITPNAIAPMAGERVVTLSTDRATSNYANVNAGQTVSLPWDIWLGAGARPRYLMVQVRLMNRNYTVAARNDIPLVRVDLEGVR